MDMSRKSFNEPNSSYRHNPITTNVLSTSTGIPVSHQESNQEGPPVIPRRLNDRPITGYNQPFHSGYGSMYGSPSYQSYFPGTQGYGYAGFGNGIYNNSFNQQSLTNNLQDATRSTFQSAESIIQAFSSVSMMLGSTLFAVQNSIQAIASVADQFSNLKYKLLSSILSTIRAIKYYFRKLLVMFKIRKPLSNEKIWEKETLHIETKYVEELMNGTTEIRNNPEKKHWPLIFFFAVTVGMPWMLWKLLQMVNNEQQANKSWEKGNEEHYIAEVNYDYTAQNEDELSLKLKETIHIAPKHKQPNVRGWLLASNGDKKGLVPANYVKILGKNRKSEKLSQTRNASTSKINEEIAKKDSISSFQDPKTMKDNTDDEVLS